MKTRKNRHNITGRRMFRHRTYGTAALKPESAEDFIYREFGVRVRRMPKPVACIPVGYLLFLCCMLVLTGMSLIHYMKLQAEFTIHVKTVSRLESELYEKKTENDDRYTAVVNRVNLDEIRQTAIEELGMRYPEEWQIIYYDGRIPDYVHQMRDIPAE